MTSADATPITINADGSLQFETTASDFLNALGGGETFTSTFVYTVADSNFQSSVNSLVDELLPVVADSVISPAGTITQEVLA